MPPGRRAPHRSRQPRMSEAPGFPLASGCGFGWMCALGAMAAVSLPLFLRSRPFPLPLSSDSRRLDAVGSLPPSCRLSPRAPASRSGAVAGRRLPLCASLECPAGQEHVLSAGRRGPRARLSGRGRHRAAGIHAVLAPCWPRSEASVFGRPLQDGGSARFLVAFAV